MRTGKDWVEDAKLLMQPGPGLDHAKESLSNIKNEYGTVFCIRNQVGTDQILSALPPAPFEP
jgi:hypothetical protein